jgi:sec-independent protein translocase protein TatC
MFVIMVPLYLMYEISIWVALIFARKKAVPPSDELADGQPT